MDDAQDTLHFLDYWRVIRSRKEVIIAVFLVVVITGFLVTYSLPKEYESSIVIQVEEESPNVEVWQPERRWFNPLFLRTQFEIIQSRPVLEEVVRKTQLDRKLAKAYGYHTLPPKKSFERTLQILKSSMKVQQFRDTNLIEIRITLSEPKDTVTEEVSRIATTLAEAYKQQRQQRSRDAKDLALRALKESLDEREKIVKEKRDKTQAIIVKYQLDVIDTFNDSMRDLLTERMRQLESMRITVRLELAEQQATYDTIKGLSEKALMDGGVYIVNDLALQQLISSKRAGQVKLGEAQELYGKEHPTVRSLKSMVRELDLQIKDALNGVKKASETSFIKTKAKYDMVEKELEDVRQKSRQAKALGNREYNTAYQEWERARKIRNVLEMRHIQEEVLKRIPKTMVEVVQPSKTPDKDAPVSPNVLLNIILSIIVGIGSGIGLAYFVEYLDTSVKTIEDIERNLGMNVLGVIPQKVKSFMDDASNTAHGEAYRVLRTNIQFSKKLKGGKTLCVTSGSVGEGKSLTLSNLAYVCSQLGDRTLVVDTDLHRPRQHKILKVSNANGLANVLVGELALEDAVMATDHANLDFLSSGKLSTPVHGLLDTSRMKELVSELKESYDLVLFDSPPIIGISDSSLLVREADGVLLVVQHRKYPLGVSVRARTIIENLGANLIGVVLNNINISRDYSYYYYHHSYSYPQKTTGGGSK